MVVVIVVITMKHMSTCFLQVGAGEGQWQAELRRLGADVLAFDNHSSPSRFGAERLQVPALRCRWRTRRRRCREPRKAAAVGLSPQGLDGHEVLAEVRRRSLDLCGRRWHSLWHSLDMSFISHFYVSL